MRKSMTVGLFGMLLVFCGLSSHSMSAQRHDSSRTASPKACYFFVPEKQNATELPEELIYGNSVNEVWRLWCTTAQSSPDQRQVAVDNMVKSWKAVWERDDPFNAEFHETSASDLLEVMALTHEMPPLMVKNPGFTKEWVEACAESCFTIWGVPENATEEHGLAMKLWLRNDLLDHLKNEPASELVIKMLEDAQYRLVD